MLKRRIEPQVEEQFQEGADVLSGNYVAGSEHDEDDKAKAPTTPSKEDYDPTL